MAVTQIESLTGVLPALVSPLHRDGSADESGIKRLLEHVIGGGVHGVLALGSTGEGAAVGERTRWQILKSVVEATAGRVPVICGVAQPHLEAARGEVAAAARLGAQAALVAPPFYYPTDQTTVLAFYRRLAAESKIPLLLYNIPQRTGVDMPNDLLAELAQIEHIDGVKQANPDDLALVDGLDLYAGNDDMLCDVLELGGAGGVLVGAQLVGDEMRRMVDEPERRREIDAGLADVYEALSVTTNPIPVKAALNLLGHEVGGLRLPLVEATEEEVAAIRSVLDRHGLLAATTT